MVRVQPASTIRRVKFCSRLAGGGAALDFSFSSNEVLHDEAYEVDLGIEGGVKTTSDSHFDTEVTAIAFTNVMHLKGPDIDGHYHREFGRESARSCGTSAVF